MTCSKRNSLASLITVVNQLISGSIYICFKRALLKRLVRLNQQCYSLLKLSLTFLFFCLFTVYFSFFIIQFFPPFGQVFSFPVISSSSSFTSSSKFSFHSTHCSTRKKRKKGKAKTPPDGLSIPSYYRANKRPCTVAIVVYLGTILCQVAWKKQMVQQKL